MTPIERAVAWHAASGCEMSFPELLEAHGRTGYVIATPEVFVMVRRVRSDWEEDLFDFPWVTDRAGDCWHVWLAAGDWLKGLESFMPYPLPFISMHRHERLRVYPLSRFRRLKWRDMRPAGEACGNGKQGAETKRPGTPATRAEDGGRGGCG